MNMPRSAVRILLVEDNPDHALLSRRALRGDGVEVVWVKDGREAIDLLRRETPALILLDVNMPRVGGHEVLAHVKADPRLRTTPVVLLTTSAEPVDIERGYHAGANSFVTKPVTFTEFTRAVRTIRDYWIGLNRLPETPASVAS
jgi:two-component system response regulator